MLCGDNFRIKKDTVNKSIIAVIGGIVVAAWGGLAPSNLEATQQALDGNEAIVTKVSGTLGLRVFQRRLLGPSDGQLRGHWRRHLYRYLHGSIKLRCHGHSVPGWLGFGVLR